MVANPSGTDAKDTLRLCALKDETSWPWEGSADNSGSFICGGRSVLVWGVQCGIRISQH